MVLKWSPSPIVLGSVHKQEGGEQPVFTEQRPGRLLEHRVPRG